MNPRRSLLREALSVLRPVHVLAQIGLAVLVFLLSILWLRLSDASAAWLVVTVVLGVVILLTAGAGEAALLLALTGESRSRAKLLRGALIVLVLIALWFGWTVLLSHHGDDGLRAAYINSKLPHRLRYTFSFENLLLLLRWLWDAVAWIGTGILAALLLPLIPDGTPLRSTGCALRSLSFWITLVLGTLAASLLTGELLQWTAGSGLSIELVSLFFRLGLTALIDAVVVCLFLAVIAVCVRRVNTQPVTPAGTPDVSQPRTAPNP
jgi:hypothetical protein